MRAIRRRHSSWGEALGFAESSRPLLLGSRAGLVSLGCVGIAGLLLLFSACSALASQLALPEAGVRSSGCGERYPDALEKYLADVRKGLRKRYAVQPNNSRLCPLASSQTLTPPLPAVSAAANSSESKAQSQAHLPSLSQSRLNHQHRQPHSQHQQQPEQQPSPPAKPTLLVLVVSRRAHSQARRLARSTWLRSSLPLAPHVDARAALQFVPQAGRENGAGVGVGRGAAGGGGVGGNGDASASSSADGFAAPRELELEVGHVFAVGRGSAAGAELAAEARTFGDVLELDVLEGEHEEFADTLLALAGLHWLMHQCPLADFVLRTNDALALNLHFWLSTLHAARGGRVPLMAGFWASGEVVPRAAGASDCVPRDVFTRRYYPNYLRAPMILNSEAVQAVVLGYSYSYSRSALPRADTFIAGVLAEWMSVMLQALQALVLPLSRLPHVDVDACASRIAAIDVSAIAAIPSALPAGAADSFKDALRKLERAASRQRTQARHFERPPTCVEPDGFLYDSSGSRTSIPTPVLVLFVFLGVLIVACAILALILVSLLCCRRRVTWLLMHGATPHGQGGR